MQKADIDYIKDVDIQLLNWQSKVEKLKQWITKNGVMHSDYEQKYRELNNARWKINQLIERKS